VGQLSGRWWTGTERRARRCCTRGGQRGGTASVGAGGRSRAGWSPGDGAETTNREEGVWAGWSDVAAALDRASGGLG
jgi:hypothetical protein